MLTLTEEQELAVKNIVNEPTQAALIASEMGSGKTLVSVEAAIRTAERTIVVICPLSTRVGWEKTFKGQGCSAPVLRVDGTKKGKEHFEQLKNGEKGVYLFGREYFKRLDWRNIRPDVVIADEVHFASNRQSLASRVLRRIKGKRLMLAVSGTPSGNSFSGMWAVTRWLWPDIIDRSYWRWVAEYCRSEHQYFASGDVVKVVGEKNPGRFVSELPLYIRHQTTLESEYIEETRYVELTPAQRKVYNQMEADALAWLADEPLVAEMPIVKRIRLRQMALGMPTITEDGEVNFDPECKSSKIDALKEILNDDSDEPFLILTDSARFAKVVTHRLGDKARLWSGEVKHSERDALLDTFGIEYKYLVATIPSVAEGIDMLQHRCARMVWLNKADSRLLNEQAAARLHRTGQTRDVYSYVLSAVDTADDEQYLKLKTDAVLMERSLSND